MSFFKNIFKEKTNQSESVTPESQWTSFVNRKIKDLCRDKTHYQHRQLDAANDFILADIRSKNWELPVEEAEAIFQNYITDIINNHIGKLRYNGILREEDLSTISRGQTIIGESIQILNNSKNPQTINTRIQIAGENSYELVLFEDNPDFRKAWKVQQLPSQICNEIAEKRDDFFLDVYLDQLKAIEDSFDAHTKITQKKNKLSKLLDKTNEIEDFIIKKEKLTSLKLKIKTKIDFYYVKDIIEQGDKLIFKKQMSKAKDILIDGDYFLKAYYSNIDTLDALKEEIRLKIAETETTNH